MSTTTAAFAVVVLDRVAEGFAGKRTSTLSAGAVKADEGAGEFAIRRGEWLTRGPYRRVMAKKHITQMIDDLDGRIIEDGTTLTFSLEGRHMKSIFHMQMPRDSATHFTRSSRLRVSPDPRRRQCDALRAVVRSPLATSPTSARGRTRTAMPSTSAVASPPPSSRPTTPRTDRVASPRPRLAHVEETGCPAERHPVSSASGLCCGGQTRAARPAPAARRSAARPSAAASGVTPRTAASSKTRRMVSPMPATRPMICSSVPCSFATPSR